MPAPSELEKAMECCILKYDEYASGKFSMSRDDFKKMLHAEFRSLFGGLSSKALEKALDGVARSLDCNSDNRIWFTEFLNFVAGVAESNYESHCKSHPLKSS
ncbi:protein S100-A10-like [Protopterus annectens]|uniref:protein S100-A10-like n=1 Tax=Protopterus annectens TaxID=7888 RepID=UPI001CFA3533|nr:protein S100-A10-like [Protopterus annectens]